MSGTGSGESRYPNRGIAAGPKTIVDGSSLGRAILPNDLFAWVRRAMELDDDEIVALFKAGADAFDALPPDAPATQRWGLTVAEAAQASAAARDVTPSRIKAWRTRNRPMTWDELRVLLRACLL